MWQDTICAIATPPGQGGVSVIRISGPQTSCLIQTVFHSKTALKPRRLTFGKVVDSQGRILDECLAVYMPEPHSYTGEDVAEIHCHGGFLVTQAILDALLATGARLAKPGEFTQRAFLNGKLDLSQAEAVIDVIEAKSQAALALSQRQLAGQMGQAVKAIADQLLDLLAEVEMVADYPEEEDQLEQGEGFQQRVAKQLEAVQQLLSGADNGKLYREGIEIAIVGPVNAGKSSLLNALLEEDRAIVTNIPGTTRDTIKETFLLDGMVLKLTDTAGFRQTDDQVEALGIARSQQVLEQAEVVIAVFDATQPVPEEWFRRLEGLQNKPVLVLWNKIDQTAAQPPQELLGDNRTLLATSLVQGQGLSELKDALRRLTAQRQQAAATAPGLFNSRQKEALLRAEKALQAAYQGLQQGVLADFAAVDLKEAWQALGEITGNTSGEDILNRVFSRFCLGK